MLEHVALGLVKQMDGVEAMSSKIVEFRPGRASVWAAFLFQTPFSFEHAMAADNSSGLRFLTHFKFDVV